MADIDTTIVQGTLVKGRVAGDGDVVVLGRIEGEIVLSKTLYVEEAGVVVANIDVEQAVVGGVVAGTLRARTAVQVTETGRVVGEIIAPRIVVAEGARLDASLNTGISERTEERTARSAATAKPSRAGYTRHHTAPPPSRSRSESVVGRALPPLESRATQRSASERTHEPSMAAPLSTPLAAQPETAPLPEREWDETASEPMTPERMEPAAQESEPVEVTVGATSADSAKKKE